MTNSAFRAETDAKLHAAAPLAPRTRSYKARKEQIPNLLRQSCEDSVEDTVLRSAER